jgi:hypothetical protein
LKHLGEDHVRPVFAGALALHAHGVTRATEDIGVLIHPEKRGVAVRSLHRTMGLSEHPDSLMVFRDRKTGVEVDVLVPYDDIALDACSAPMRTNVRGHQISVVRLPSLIA